MTYKIRLTMSNAFTRASTMAKTIISWVSREKRRQTNKAVGGSFLKTITELLTNSDNALSFDTKNWHCVAV